MDEYSFTLEDDGNYTLVLSDQGVAVPATHASTHGSGGSDPVSILLSQVSNAGTMASQNASSVSISGGSVSATLVSSNATLSGGSIDGMTIGATVPASGNFTQINATNLDVAGIIADTISLSAPLPLTEGGTGAASAAAARTNLGLGSLSLQNSTSVSVTGGSISSVTLSGATISGGTSTGLALTSATFSGTISSLATDLAIADGGTGASSAAAARTNLFVPAITDTTRWSSTITGYTGGGSTNLDGLDISNTTIWPTGSSIAFSVSNNHVIYRLTATGAAENSPFIIRPDSYGGREWTLISLTLDSVVITGGSISGVVYPVNVQTGSYTILASDEHVVANSATDITFTLPAVAGNAGRRYFVKNRGTGVLTLAAAGADQLFTDAAESSINLLTGDGVAVFNDGTHWNLN